MTKDTDNAATPWPHLQEFIDCGGNITVGDIPPISCAAVAADEHTMHVALVGRDRENLVELLTRLDLALDKALTEEILIDEING